MFDVGFSELIVIAVVALIVIGPERLPKVARTVGHLLGRLQRYVNDVKSDINREMQLDDLKKLQQQMAEQVKGVEQSVSEHMNSVETSLNESIAQGLADKPAVPTAGSATDPVGVPPPLNLDPPEKPKA
jgi:sec-independent protein translocase protein TatB